MLEKVGDDAVVVHIHLGMSGSFRLYPFPGTMDAVNGRSL